MSKKRPKPINTKRIMAMIMTTLVACAMLFLTDKCSHRKDNPFGSGLPEKSGGDTLDVAIEISPLSYSMSGDTVSGLDYDMLRQISAAHGRTVKFHAFAPLRYAINGLTRGTFDIVVTSLPSTQKLKKELLLTDAVYLDRQVLVQRKQSVDSAAYVHTAGDMGGLEVWIGDGSPLAERLANLSAEIGDTIVVRSSPGRTAEHLMYLVAAGSIDRAVVNEGIARTICQTDSTLSYNTPVSFTQFQTWAVSPQNTALRDTLNRWIEQYKATDAYHSLLDRYRMPNP